MDERKTGQGKYIFSNGLGEYSGGFSSGVQEGHIEFDLIHPDDDDEWGHFEGHYLGGYRKTGTADLQTLLEYEGMKDKECKSKPSKRCVLF